MLSVFHGSWTKVKRAKKHIADLHELVLAFSNSDFHSASIDYDAELRTNYLCFDLDFGRFPYDDCAVITGDALHNLRSALDLLWQVVVLKCGGKPTPWSHFPIYDSRDTLVGKLNEALKKKLITPLVATHILDPVKPYLGGNQFLHALHTLNIGDKHQLLIPVLKLVGVFDVALEDERGRAVGRREYIMDESCRIRLRDALYSKVTVKNKGRATAQILFDEETALGGTAINATLGHIAEMVTRTIESFEILLRQA